MKTVTLGVSSIEDTKRQMAAAFRGEQQGEFISFASIGLLWKVADRQTVGNLARHDRPGGIINP